MKKLAIALFVLVLICCFAAPSMAIVIKTNMREIYLERPYCGRSGNIDIYFSAADIYSINELLNDPGGGPISEFVLLRIHLNVTGSKKLPVLCANIQRDSDGDTTDPDPGQNYADTDDFHFTNPAATWNDVVTLHTIETEVSDGVGDGSGTITEAADTNRDLDAFAHATQGNSYIDVVIYGLPDVTIIPAQLPASYGSDYTTWPRLSVGLDPTDPLLPAGIDDAESHAIHVKLSRNASLKWQKLEVSMYTWPNILTYTSSNAWIGIFLK